MSGSEQTNSPKVSVVIPVYNTQAYLEAAVRSIMQQSLSDLQIIIVNDGSNDGSLSIAQSLAAQDPRIQIISQSNKGLSCARNAGLDQSTGQFIYFMDSDDLLESDALELCYQRCIESQLDLVFFDAESFGNTNSDDKWFDYRRARHFPKQSYDGQQLLSEMLELECFRASACLSFIRLSYLRELGLRFYPGILHEDELFTPQLYLGSKRIGGIERSFFKRRLREGSIMNVNFSQRNLNGYLRVIDDLKSYGQNADERSKKTIARLIKNIVCAILRNAWQLPFTQRIALAYKLIHNHTAAIKISLLGTMLLKAPLKKLCGK